jgi:hypothetical protein
MNKVGEAETFNHEELKNSPRAAREMIEFARQPGIGLKTLKKARDRDKQSWQGCRMDVALPIHAVLAIALFAFDRDVGGSGLRQGHSNSFNFTVFHFEAQPYCLSNTNICSNLPSALVPLVVATTTDSPWKTRRLFVGKQSEVHRLLVEISTLAFFVFRLAPASLWCPKNEMQASPAPLALKHAGLPKGRIIAL